MALGSPKDASPEDFWLHQLYLHLQGNNSELLFAASKEGGMIVSACVASATFCSQLERHALEQSEPGNCAGAERLRTDANQVESSSAQNSDKTPKRAEDRPAVKSRNRSGTPQKPRSMGRLSDMADPEKLSRLQKRSAEAWRVGRNIDKFRKECGWSFDKLAKKTGIDKKLILSHVNQGAKPHPNTMKEYAQAFAKELNRHITANNLEE